MFRLDRFAGAPFVQRLRRTVPYVALAVLPGSLLTLPALIWWRRRRQATPITTTDGSAPENPDA